MTGHEDEYFVSNINDLLLGKYSDKPQPLKALYNLINTNAKSLLQFNPKNMKNFKHTAFGIRVCW